MVDFERYKRLDRIIYRLRKRSVYQLTGQQYEELAWASSLARRCFDRDTHFQAIDRAISSVLVELKPQFESRPRIRALRIEQKRLLGIPTEEALG